MATLEHNLGIGRFVVIALGLDTLKQSNLYCKVTAFFLSSVISQGHRRTVALTKDISPIEAKADGWGEAEGLLAESGHLLSHEEMLGSGEFEVGILLEEVHHI